MRTLHAAIVSYLILVLGASVAEVVYDHFMHTYTVLSLKARLTKMCFIIGIFFVVQAVGNQRKFLRSPRYVMQVLGGLIANAAMLMAVAFTNPLRNTCLDLLASAEVDGRITYVVGLREFEDMFLFVLLFVLFALFLLFKFATLPASDRNTKTAAKEPT